MNTRKQSFYPVFPQLVIYVAATLGCTFAAIAQAPPIELSRIVLTTRHSEIISVPGATTGTQVTQIKSSNPSVATAQPYGSNQIQIVAVAPGLTTVTFFNNTVQQRYIQPVWVEAANATGGGGTGYDPANKIELSQIVMAIKRTQNVGVPGSSSPRISGVRSSNPSVATARTNPPGGIQIYSVALGDTFIEFTDNATGNVYQVHVWVTNASGLPPAGSGPGPGAVPTSTPRPNPTPKPQNPNTPRPTLPAGGIDLDPCLIGNWVAVEVIDLRDSWTGGTGFKVNFTRNGIQTVDYNSMAQFTKANDSMTWRGKTVSLIYTQDGGAVLFDITSGDLKMTLGAPSNNAEFPFGTAIVGPGGLGGLATVATNYTCTRDTLTYNTSWARDKRANYRVTLRRGSGGNSDNRTSTTSGLRASQPPPARSGIDRCVIGTWRSQPISDAVFNSAYSEMYRAGGIVFSVTADGSASFNYDGTKTMAGGTYGASTSTTTVRGSVRAKIKTDQRNHSLMPENEPTSEATVSVRGPDEAPRDSRLHEFLPSGVQLVEYTCSPTTLTFKFGQGAMHFAKVN